MVKKLLSKTGKNNMAQRFWEIDFMRGIAIFMMVVFHSIWDLNYFYNFDLDFSAGFLKIFQVLTASLFIFLVGVSSYLSSQKKNTSFKTFFKRGLKVFSFGLLITIVTKIFFPSEYIVFGILHFIGVAIVLSYFFLNLKYINLFFGFLLIMVGGIIKNNYFNFSYLLPFGFMPENFSSLDYFPIFPWFGTVLFGMFWAQLFYKDNERLFEFNLKNNNIIFKKTSYIGKHSLIIYLFHQPVLFLLFYLPTLI